MIKSRDKETPCKWFSAGGYYYSVRYNYEAISKNQFHAGLSAREHGDQ